MASAALAIYASNSQGEDVTAQVNALVSSGNDDIPVNNETFVDPDPGAKKYFMVWYTAPSLNNGNPIGLAAQEGSSVDLIPASPPQNEYCTAPQPSLAKSDISAITVTQAVYGTVDNGFDVTAACQAIVNQGAVGEAGTYSIAISNDTFGGDPDVKATKYFAMQYQVGASGPSFVGGKEGQTVTLQSAAIEPPVIIVPPTNGKPTN